MNQSQAQAQAQNRFILLDKCKELAIKTYKLCKILPKEERYGIISQMQRAAISVGSNIAEGRERKEKDNINFIRTARGSLYELKIQLEIVENIYADLIEDSCEEMYLLIDEIGKMSYGLSQSLCQRLKDGIE